jgi:mevalonate kinase
LSGNAQQLISEANAHFQAAQTAARNGDWATYGTEMNIVQQLLSQLQSVVGTPAPSAP